MNTVYIGLGSNLSDPSLQITQALEAINNITNSQIEAVSSLYVSRPMGPQDQPDYCNAVIELSSELPPIEILDALQSIENAQGRVRKENRWGARTLDLDILLYNDDVIHCSRLDIPHYGMKEREFVLVPLAEIAPHCVLPCGDKVTDLAKNIEKNNLKKQGKILRF